MKSQNALHRIQKLFPKVKRVRDATRTTKMTPDYQIKAQDFRRWLEKQPDDRRWHYFDTNNCVICSFLRETGVATHPSVGGNNFCFTQALLPEIPLPIWLADLVVKQSSTFCAADLKAAFSTP